MKNFISILSDLGSIEVSTIAGNRVLIEVIRKVRTNNRRKAERVLDDLDIEFRRHGRDVNILAKYRKNRSRIWGLGGPRLSLKYRVKVPRRYNMNLQTAGGSISVDDLIGTVQAKTSGGSLHFGDIQGPVFGRTSGGSISLDGCEGKADIKTSGGSISIGKVDGNILAHTSGGSIHIEQAKGNIQARTSGGSIRVKEVMGTIDASTSGGSVSVVITRQPDDDCRLVTSGGSITVRLAYNIAVDVDAKTSSGRVRTEFPVTVRGELKKNVLKATINGGGPLLYLRTSGGNININRL